MTRRHAILVIDLAFGDCGKGTIVDFLACRCRATTVVRFNGGPQAGHNVVTADGRHHTFSQFGSGSLVPGVLTFLSRFMLIEPYALLNEAAHLEQIGVTDPMDRLFIDARCPVITPFHQAANRLREIARADVPHGTCGLGVGETMTDLIDHRDLMLFAADLSNRARVRRKLQAIHDLKLDQLHDVIAVVRAHPRAQPSLETLLDASWIDAALDNYANVARRASIVGELAARSILLAPGTLIFEGAQGLLLDEYYGFHPHTTWSKTNFANADALLDEAGHDSPRTHLGVLRTYFTRHGPGPLVTEDPTLRPQLPEPHNDEGGWQGAFRVGVFDAVAARYALSVAGPVDALAITHVDRIGRLPPHICHGYRDDSPFHASEDAGDPFIRHDRLIRDIRLRPQPSLAEMTSRTQSLSHCRPVHTPAPMHNADAFLDLLQSELRTPIALTSSGLTRQDKSIEACMTETLKP